MTTTTIPDPCTTPNSALGPCDLQAAYALPSATAGVGQTIAIVDAYDNPSAEADLAVYRTRLGLPPCTTANGCFRKISQTGTTTYPTGNVSWAQETSLDLDMVSAICPNCHILLVEANSSAFTDLGVAVDQAATFSWSVGTSTFKANAISNSYGALEFSSEATYELHYNHPGIAITASSGDSGYGPQYPAASQYVTAVGGTKLVKNATTTRGWTESIWAGAGSGCSAYITKPTWQKDTTGCSKRTISDVSAVADPASAVAVYDTYGSAGWLAFGGTSVSAPIIAAIYGLAGNAASLTYGSAPYVSNPNQGVNLDAYLTAPSSLLNDVTTGSNGTCATYICDGKVGFDGPSGTGTPKGIGAF
ncbi:MAG: peptidase S8 [Actinomycetes bacterium]